MWGAERKGKVFFITGASHGFGYYLAEEALILGYNVVATSRNIETLKPLISKYPDQAISLILNVRNKEKICNGISTTISKFGRINILINNAGYNDVLCLFYLFLFIFILFYLFLFIFILFYFYFI
jgi:NADP-dependent 3-hydroxy acid dehydrogenase YdfG